ncbi:MAG TPA: hypothetical protein PLN13_07770 [Bacteroidia bacterium]|nr:hypothetical protein [Bacteroidia bacterium]
MQQKIPIKNYDKNMPEREKRYFIYCVANANFMHPRCKRGRVGVGENRYFYLLRYKRKFYASALQTRTSRVGKIGILFIALQTQILRHPRCKRGRVEWGKLVFLFIALQTQILCIRVTNADEWE